MRCASTVEQVSFKRTAVVRRTIVMFDDVDMREKCTDIDNGGCIHSSEARVNARGIL